MDEDIFSNDVVIMVIFLEIKNLKFVYESIISLWRGAKWSGDVILSRLHLLFDNVGARVQRLMQEVF